MNGSAGTLTRADLAETINRKMGFSRAESLDLVESILGHMCESMSKGENVKISGFGSFVLRDKAERIGRNPKTGVEVPDQFAPGDDVSRQPGAERPRRAIGRGVITGQGRQA